MIVSEFPLVQPHAVLVTLAGWFFATLGLFRMFAASAYQQGAARTPTPVFMVLEGILLLGGIVMTFKAYFGGEIEGRGL